MNSLQIFGKHYKPISKLILSGVQQNSVRTALIISRDWIPGKRPETEEEKKKAAKKYNLLPVEYEVQPDDGLSTGDYPHLEDKHNDNRDPFYPWDYPQWRTNYGEALPDTFAITTYDKWNRQSDLNNRVGIWKQLLWFFGYFIIPVFSIVYFIGVKYRYYCPHFGEIKYEKGVTRYEYPSK